MTVATKESEVQEASEEADVEDVENEDGLEDERAEHEDDLEDDGEGWLVIYVDGEQQVVPHPEDKTREEVVQLFFEAKKKQHHAFQLGGWVFDTGTIRAFGWADDCDHPEIERFDGLQERIEGLAMAAAELFRQQEALQNAHAALIQGELAEMQSEAMETAVQAAQDEAPALQAAAPDEARKAGGFRPPGA